MRNIRKQASFLNNNLLNAPAQAYRPCTEDSVATVQDILTSDPLAKFLSTVANQIKAQVTGIQDDIKKNLDNVRHSVTGSTVVDSIMSTLRTLEKDPSQEVAEPVSVYAFIAFTVFAFMVIVISLYTIDSSSRLRSGRTVLNVYMKLREEHPHVGVKETCRTTSEYTGVSFRKILDINPKRRRQGGKLTTPSRKKPGSENRRRRTAMYEGLTLCALRNIVHDLFRCSEPPTAQKIAEEFRRGNQSSVWGTKGGICGFRSGSWMLCGGVILFIVLFPGAMILASGIVAVGSAVDRILCAPAQDLSFLDDQSVLHLLLRKLLAKSNGTTATGSNKSRSEVAPPGGVDGNLEDDGFEVVTEIAEQEDGQSNSRSTSTVPSINQTPQKRSPTGAKNDFELKQGKLAGKIRTERATTHTLQGPSELRSSSRTLRTWQIKQLKATFPSATSTDIQELDEDLTAGDRRNGCAGDVADSEGCKEDSTATVVLIESKVDQKVQDHVGHPRDIQHTSGASLGNNKRFGTAPSARDTISVGQYVANKSRMGHQLQQREEEGRGKRQGVASARLNVSDELMDSLRKQLTLEAMQGILQRLAQCSSSHLSLYHVIGKDIVREMAVALLGDKSPWLTLFDEGGDIPKIDALEKLGQNVPTLTVGPSLQKELEDFKNVHIKPDIFTVLKTAVSSAVPQGATLMPLILHHTA
ncbi:hypothetical protein HPB48_007134 [Haemaphysalis longicornis]|uniref:Transmembrane protein n=1 Tax=Haemaphysalis longicornis TaxID=44386 RepID=A0A9J6FSJ7_HAELO|nr:hypothetical protein HPB48_007134 [Haemaphysalis longicornis]